MATNVTVTPTNSKAGTATNGDVTLYNKHDTHTNDNVTAENSSGSVPCETDTPTSNGATPENGSCENTSNVTDESTSGEKEIIDGNSNRLSTRLCEKKGFFKRFDFQKKRFLQQKKRFSVPNG